MVMEVVAGEIQLVKDKPEMIAVVSHIFNQQMVLANEITKQFKRNGVLK